MVGADCVDTPGKKRFAQHFGILRSLDCRIDLMAAVAADFVAQYGVKIKRSGLSSNQLALCRPITQQFTHFSRSAYMRQMQPRTETCGKLYGMCSRAETGFVRAYAAVFGYRNRLYTPPPRKSSFHIAANDIIILSMDNHGNIMLSQKAEYILKFIISGSGHGAGGCAKKELYGRHAGNVKFFQLLHGSRRHA